MSHKRVVLQLDGQAVTGVEAEGPTQVAVSHVARLFLLAAVTYGLHEFQCAAVAWCVPQHTVLELAKVWLEEHDAGVDVVESFSGYIQLVVLDFHVMEEGIPKVAPGEEPIIYYPCRG